MVSIGRSSESKEKSRAFLQAVYDNGGRAPTSAITSATGLTRGEIKYRYEMLEAQGLIEVSYTDTLSAAGESPVKVAELTELANEEINKGLLQGGQYQPVASDVEEVASDVVEIQNYISETLLPLVRDLSDRVEELESQK